MKKVFGLRPQGGPHKPEEIKSNSTKSWIRKIFEMENMNERKTGENWTEEEMYEMRSDHSQIN